MSQLGSSQVGSRQHDVPRASERHLPSSQLDPKQDLVQYMEAYARENPKVVALWCFGVGFILGWKLKPW